LACKIENFNVVVTLANNLASDTPVEIYIDSAFVLPKVPGITSNGIKIQAKWAGITLVNDSTKGSPLNIGLKIDSQIQIRGITIEDIVNVGESAAYKFSFSSTDIETDDYFVIQFPRSDTGSGFDPYLGDATNRFSVLMPELYELKCSSSSLGKVSCKPNHWYLTVSYIGSTVSSGTDIDLTVYDIRNPYMVTDGKFNMWHYDFSGNAKAFGSSTQYTQTTNPSKTKVILKSVDTDNDAQSSLADYTFEFYPTNSSELFTSDTVFYVRFPEQFNIDLWKSNSIACSSVLCSSITNSTNCDKTWNSNQLCTVSGYKVILGIQSQNSVSMTQVSRVVLTMPNINNPSNGLSRQRGSGFDTYDTKTFGEFNFWSSKFEIGVLNTVKKTLSRSYGLLNSGYHGYTQESSSIGVDYSGSSNRIALIPGQQSNDISIKISNSWPSVDKSIKFIPSIDGTGSSYIKVSSKFHGWVLKQMHSEIKFRIAALQGAPNGIYYISWTLSENSQDPNVSMYDAPASILVEVHTKPGKLFKINVAKIPALYAGYSSVPVCVTLENSPASSLIITPTFDSPGIFANKASLQFAPDVNSLCFSIDVQSSFSASKAVLSFELSGTDSNIFKKPDSINLFIDQLSTSPMPASIKLQSSVKDGSSVSISVTSDYDAILYWSITCKGADIMSFSTMVAYAPVLTDSNSTTLADQLAEEYANKETDINPNEGDNDIYAFFSRQHAEHCLTDYISSQVIYSKTSSNINIGFLYGGTDYTFTAYADHKLLSDTSLYQPAVINFTTTALQPIMTLSISCSSYGDVSVYSYKIQNTIAKYCGVNPSWIYYIGPTSSANRRLQASTAFNYYVLYDPSFPQYPSSTIIENFSKSQASAMSELKQTLSLASSPSYTVTTVTSNANPTWDSPPYKKKSSKDGEAK